MLHFVCELISLFLEKYPVSQRDANVSPNALLWCREAAVCVVSTK